jgi:hypothetical protein
LRKRFPLSGMIAIISNTARAGWVERLVLHDCVTRQLPSNPFPGT